MKKTIFAMTILFAMASANATVFGNQTNNHGGKGGDAAAGVNSSIKNDNDQLQGQAQGQMQKATSNSGGNSISIGGDVTESNTPPVVAGVLPSVPTSCRLYLFGGGANRDGAGSGTFPIGNDQTCLSIATLNLMERAGGFTQAEKQNVVCKVEGMADFPTCKAANQTK